MSDVLARIDDAVDRRTLVAFAGYVDDIVIEDAERAPLVRGAAELRVRYEQLR
ncbi:MAG TPA: hypothetical protein VFI37_02705 [Gaiellaceae bacterium]|jgi:hypothetical protein|nr:hypothetical protein [Gaiellaceae bacterium]